MRGKGGRAIALSALVYLAVSPTAAAQWDAEKFEAVTTRPEVSAPEGRATNVCLVAGNVAMEQGGMIVIDGFGCDWRSPLGLGPADMIAVSTHPSATKLGLEGRDCGLASPGRWTCSSQDIPRKARQQLRLGVEFPYGGSVWSFDVGPPFPEPQRALAHLPLRISSGGEVARHVCFAGGSATGPGGRTAVFDQTPCTSEYAPLLLSVNDRLDVVAPAQATAVRVTPSTGQGGEGRACRRSAVPGSWACRPPAVPWGREGLIVRIDYPEAAASWRFQAKPLPRGFRATDRRAGVRFRLAGRHLRMQLVPRRNHTPPDGRAWLWGKRLAVLCASRRGGSRPATDKVIKRVLWPDGQLSVSLSFARRLDGPPRWCLAEDRTGVDVARVRFPRRG